MIKYPAIIFLNIVLLACLMFPEFLTSAPSSHYPVLVLATDQNFGSFTCEILKTEGFNGFQKDSLTDKITLKYLKKFKVIIVTEVGLTTAQKEMLSIYVKEGGNLIAFKPDKKLSNVFGINYSGGMLNEGYISIDTASPIGKGITHEALQFHGEADKCDLKAGKIIASLYTSAATPTRYPAIVVNDYGKGHALAFLYNLPKSIVYTRQGNFRYAGEERDGITGVRAMDLFTDGWVDTTKNRLNQADEQMRLLSHAIEKMNPYPLPRFWYFPDTLQCLVTLNNDGEDSKEEEFNQQFEDVDSMGAKMTLYVKEVDLISRPWIHQWISKGFEISGHPDDTRQAGDPDWKTMDGVYENIIMRLNREYDIPAMPTTTNHWFVWCGKNEDGQIISQRRQS